MRQTGDDRTGQRNSQEIGADEGDTMAERLDFLRGVNRLHAFYTENVRMLAHAYGLTDEEAAKMLDDFGYYNVARSILRPARFDAGPDEVTDEMRG